MGTEKIEVRVPRNEWYCVVVVTEKKDGKTYSQCACPSSDSPSGWLFCTKANPIYSNEYFSKSSAEEFCNLYRAYREAQDFGEKLIDVYAIPVNERIKQIVEINVSGTKKEKSLSNAMKKDLAPQKVVGYACELNGSIRKMYS